MPSSYHLSVDVRKRFTVVYRLTNLVIPSTLLCSAFHIQASGLCINPRNFTIASPPSHVLYTASSASTNAIFKRSKLGRVRSFSRATFTIRTTVTAVVAVGAEGQSVQINELCGFADASAQQSFGARPIFCFQGSRQHPARDDFRGTSEMLDMLRRRN